MDLSLVSSVVFLFPQAFAVFTFLVIFSLFSGFASFARSSGKPLVVQVCYFLTLVLSFMVLLIIPVFSFSSASVFSLLVFSPFLSVYGLLVIIVSAVVLILFSFYSNFGDLLQFEIPFFIFLTCLATLVVISADDFLTAYLGLEFQALALYILAASRVNSTYSTESGLKYFILGSFASCLLLLGISSLYGLTGVLTFSDLSLFLLSTSQSPDHQRALLLSLVLIVLGLLFKVGSAPFHFWVPDVYSGSPVVITMFFAVVPKLAAWVLLLKLSSKALCFFLEFFYNFFIFLSLLSLIVGIFGAIYQISIKRFLAYSAVSHTGYLLLSLSAFQAEGFVANFFYLFVYTLSLIPIFILLSLFFPYCLSSSSDSIYILSHMYKSNPVNGLVLALSVFSIAGVPPFSGFFSKLYLFYSVLSVGHLYAPIFAIILSCASAVYYLKVVRFSFFFVDSRKFIFFRPVPKSLAYLIAISFVLNVTFPLWGSDFLMLLQHIQTNFTL